MTWKRDTLDMTHGTRDGRPLYVDGYLSPCGRWHAWRQRTGTWVVTHAPSGKKACVEFRTLRDAKRVMPLVSADLGTITDDDEQRVIAYLRERVTQTHDRDGRMLSEIRTGEGLRHVEET